MVMAQLTSRISDKDGKINERYSEDKIKEVFPVFAKDSIGYSNVTM